MGDFFFCFIPQAPPHTSVLVGANSHGRKSGASISGPANGLFSAARIGLAACTQFELTPGWAASTQGGRGRGGDGNPRERNRIFFFFSVLCVCAETHTRRVSHILVRVCEAVSGDNLCWIGDAVG